MKTSSRERPRMYGIGITLKPLRRLTLSGIRLTTNPDCERRFSTLHWAQRPVRGHASVFCLAVLELVLSVPGIDSATPRVSIVGSFFDRPHPRLTISATTISLRFCVIEVKDRDAGRAPRLLLCQAGGMTHGKHANDTSKRSGGLDGGGHGLRRKPRQHSGRSPGWWRGQRESAERYGSRCRHTVPADLYSDIQRPDCTCLIRQPDPGGLSESELPAHVARVR